MIALTTKKMMVVAIDEVQELASLETAGKRGRIATGAAVWPTVIAVTAVIMGGLKIEISMNVICLGGRTGRRWFVCPKKWLKRVGVVAEINCKIAVGGDCGGIGGRERYRWKACCEAVLGVPV